ncbi:uncharacterized protein [Nicotiana tomentosiformis]|uniref:uncharacterized protein n=1 Tax=Nicotiana tomentosiformis TaxID=4098 RepID=UPI00388C5F1B
MDEKDAEKTAFNTPWGIYCYKMMPSGLKNAGATYMRAMMTIFNDMIHKEIEVYMDDVIIKSKRSSDHIADLKTFFDRLQKYNLKLNPAKCAFGVPAGKLLGEDITVAYDGWRMIFDGATKFKGAGIEAILVSEIGQHYPISAKLRFSCTNNMEEYEACILGLRLAINMNVRELPVVGDSDLLVHQGMNVIGLIEPAASNGQRFILVAIDYFTKWVEVASYKVVTKKVVEDFVRDHIVCRFGVPESIITDNATNLNSDLMKIMCETFKIKHQNSTAYKLQMNGAVEAANKNIKKILRKMMDNYKQWHENLPFSLLGYHTTVRTSTGATPYLLVYGTEVVILAEVEISFFKDHTRGRAQ